MLVSRLNWEMAMVRSEFLVFKVVDVNILKNFGIREQKLVKEIEFVF